MNVPASDESERLGYKMKLAVDNSGNVNASTVKVLDIDFDREDMEDFDLSAVLEIRPASKPIGSKYPTFDRSHNWSIDRANVDKVAQAASTGKPVYVTVWQASSTPKPVNLPVEGTTCITTVETCANRLDIVSNLRQHVAEHSTGTEPFRIDPDKDGNESKPRKLTCGTLADALFSFQRFLSLDMEFPEAEICLSDVGFEFGVLRIQKHASHFDIRPVVWQVR